jgi:hypothetical protein
MTLSAGKDSGSMRSATSVDGLNPAILGGALRLKPR